MPVQGFSLILQSGYLQLICLHFVLHYITSSWLWFLKTSLFAAASQDTAGQMALFAGVNTASAGAIILLQLLATVSLGRNLLRHSWTGVSPFVSCMSGVSRPMPAWGQAYH